MSYDLVALPIAADPDAFEEAAADLERIDDRPPTPSERAAMEALADALHAVDPAAGRSEDAMWILLDDGLMLVDVRNGEVELSVPYHRDGDEARIVLDRMLEYAAVLRGRGWTVWDRQLDAVIGERPPEAMYDAYGVGRAAIAGPPAPRRPWWRRVLSL